MQQFFNNLFFCCLFSIECVRFTGTEKCLDDKSILCHQDLLFKQINELAYVWKMVNNGLAKLFIIFLKIWLEKC